jgi:UDP-2,3-diacylglucosamine hydrolase
MKIVNIITLNFINNWMFKKILSKQIKCEKMKNFIQLAEYKIAQYKKCNLIIEGHYHQNQIYKNYINLPSLYCQNSFLQLKNEEFIEKSI